MRQTIGYLKQQTIEALDLAKHQWKSFAISVMILVVIYLIAGFLEPGWGTYALQLPASCVVIATAYARVNAIGPELMGWNWQVRRIGLTIIGGTTITILGVPFIENPVFPSWRGVLLMWGLAAAWITTPDMVPWNWYIAGRNRQPPPTGRVLSPLQRVIIGRETRELRIAELKKELKKAEDGK